ncbi:MAG: cation:proton antiporter [Actinobacteria bacterium]|nr:cation:proton antiporter [Actinomycetota bacterium]
MDAEFTLTNLLLVSLLAFAVPFVLAFFPRVRVASAVLELVAGIVFGPELLDWIEIDAPVEIMSSIGVAFLLFLAGMELDLRVLRGPALRRGAAAFMISLLLAIGILLVFKEFGLVETPLLIAIALSATSVGIVVPVLRDSGLLHSPAGLFTIAGSSMAEFGTIVLLGLFFARDGSSPRVEAVLLVVFGVLAVLLLRGLVWFSGREATQAIFRRLDDTSSQVRVRLAIVVLLAAAVVASAFGFEAILGTFLAGAIFAVVIRGWHDLETFRKKIDAVGFGFFVPVFFVVSGMRLDLQALLGWLEIGTVLVLLLVLLVVRALPVLLYRRYLTDREALASGLLQATNLSFVVVAVTVGEGIGAITYSGGTALIAAGLLSAVIFPPLAHALLRKEGG